MVKRVMTPRASLWGPADSHLCEARVNDSRCGASKNHRTDFRGPPGEHCAELGNGNLSGGTSQTCPNQRN